MKWNNDSVSTALEFELVFLDLIYVFTGTIDAKTRSWSRCMYIIYNMYVLYTCAFTSHVQIDYINCQKLSFLYIVLLIFIISFRWELTNILYWITKLLSSQKLLFITFIKVLIINIFFHKQLWSCSTLFMNISYVN